MSDVSTHSAATFPDCMVCVRVERMCSCSNGPLPSGGECGVCGV